MRVFSQINNCQRKNKQTNKSKRGASLLGLAKSIYYIAEDYSISDWFKTDKHD